MAQSIHRATVQVYVCMCTAEGVGHVRAPRCMQWTDSGQEWRALGHGGCLTHTHTHTQSLSLSRTHSLSRTQKQSQRSSHPSCSSGDNSHWLLCTRAGREGGDTHGLGQHGCPPSWPDFLLKKSKPDESVRLSNGSALNSTICMHVYTPVYVRLLRSILIKPQWGNFAHTHKASCSWHCV